MPKVGGPMVFFSVVCLSIMMALLILGESTLPLFAGDRELAGRVYATGFVLLAAWTVAGLAVLGMQVIGRFTTHQLPQQPDAVPVKTMHWLCAHTQPVVFAFLILIGIGMAFWVWQFETSWQIPVD